MIDSWTYRIHEGDCLDVMREMPSASVDLIITSPPYAERRKDTYGGVPASEYVEWFLPRAEQMRRLLKPTGSFVLNIKEGTQDRRRETYVLELILALVKQGWRWIDEYIWAKTCTLPIGAKERFKDEWERLLHFAPGEDPICFNKDAVRIPNSQSMKNRIAGFKKHADQPRQFNSTGSKFNVSPKTFLKSYEKHGATSLPGNVICSATAPSHNAQDHPAVFPEAIPSFFVRLLTREGDVVLDPFSGSGTTYRVAQRAGRKPIGIEIKPEYVKQENPMLL